MKANRLISSGVTALTCLWWTCRCLPDPPVYPSTKRGHNWPVRKSHKTERRSGLTARRWGPIPSARRRDWRGDRDARGLAAVASGGSAGCGHPQRSGAGGGPDWCAGMHDHGSKPTDEV